MLQVGYNTRMVTVGIDEVGRGCWAGPLVAGAVILPSQTGLGVLDDDSLGSVKLRDSKKLSKKQREVAAEWVQANALAVGLGWVWPEEIDTSGITMAVKRAMERALEALEEAVAEAAPAHGVAYDEIIIDGNINYFADNPKARAVIKADDSVPSVSAASIVAKVARDQYMAELADHEQYAGYGFASHVGYGTAAHIAALQRLGVSDIHRLSYKPIKALLKSAAGAA